MSDDHGADRSLTSRLFGWARRGEAHNSDDGHAAGPPVATRVLGKLVHALASRTSPSILDLGPVVGPNVAFFGEALGCRLQLEDLYPDVDRLADSEDPDAMATYLSTRFGEAAESFDAILCWDIFDHLDKRAAAVLGRDLAARLYPGGLIMGVFQTQLDTTPGRTKYVIVDAGHLQHRTYPAARGRRTVYQNRDIERLFPGLTVSESVLMQNRTREALLRKRMAPAASRS